MGSTPYSVAIISSGTGAYTYTYTANAEMQRGQLCAVSFRRRLEIGVVIGEEPSPEHTAKLLPLWPVSVPQYALWGDSLCEMASLCASTPREVAGYLLFSTPAAGLKLKLDLTKPDALAPKLRSAIAALVGTLTPAKRKQLMALNSWPQLIALAQAGAISLQVVIAGLPGNTRAHTKLRKLYVVDAENAQLLGLSSGEIVLPGSYLAGLSMDMDFPWPAVRRQAERSDTPASKDTVHPHTHTETPASHETPASSITWDDLVWPEGWLLHEQSPALRAVSMRRAQMSWAELRAPTGLCAELAADITTQRNTLCIVPMSWMLERIWPAMSPWAEHIHRYRSDAGASAASLVLSALAKPGHVVLGLEGAWKLAQYGDFARVVLLDPTHPGYEPHGDPWLDPRSALLLTAARRGIAMDVIEMGLSVWDGASRIGTLAILPSRKDNSSHASAEPAAGSVADLDPLPLELRQPNRRRLVYYNRLGQGRGLRCIECGAIAGCPSCSAPAMHYGADSCVYACAACGWTGVDLRCNACGTANLAARSVGVEALDRRASDVLVHGSSTQVIHPEHESVVGTSQLLTPGTGVWPEDIIYITAARKSGLVDSWPHELDMVARLQALYANPGLEHLYVVSDALHAQLGDILTEGELQERFKQEQALKLLAGLPPYGCIMYYQVRGAGSKAVANAGRDVFTRLRATAKDAVAWIGKPRGWRGGHRLDGYIANPQLAEDDLQYLRDEMKRQRISLFFRKQISPW